MELLFKKYFWTVALAFIAVAALLSAKTVNTFIDASFRGLPTGGPEAAKAAQPVVRAGSKDPSLILSRYIFNSEHKPEVPGTGPSAPAGPPTLTTQKEGDEDDGTCRASSAEETDMDIEVIALIVTDHRSWSFAQVKERRSEEAKLFKLGDTIRTEARIVDIRPRVMVITRSGKCEKFTMFEERPKPKMPGGPTPAPTGGPPSVGVDDRNIKNLGNDRFIISRDEVDKQLSNLNVLATQARIVPHFEGGQGAGFKLFAIRPGSVYSKIGIQNGDVIKQINGEMINSPDKALEAYARLKNAQSIQIDLVRNGQKKTLQYSIGN